MSAGMRQLTPDRPAAGHSHKICSAGRLRWRHRPRQDRRRRGNAGRQILRRLLAGRSERADVSVDRLLILRRHPAQGPPRHRRVRLRRARELEPLSLGHMADQKPQISGIGCTPGAVKTERAPLEPVLFGCLGVALRETVGVTVVAAADLYQIAAAGDLGGVLRAGRQRAERHPDCEQGGETSGGDKVNRLPPEVLVVRSAKMAHAGWSSPIHIGLVAGCRPGITGTISTLAFQFEKEALGKLATFEDLRHIDDEVAGALAVLRIEIGGGGKCTARTTPGSLPASMPRFCERFAWKASPWGGATQAQSRLGRVVPRTPSEAWTLS